MYFERTLIFNISKIIKFIVVYSCDGMLQTFKDTYK